jgi:hypothetical protein
VTSGRALNEEHGRAGVSTEEGSGHARDIRNPRYALDRSVNSQQQAELIARLKREAAALEVPIRTELKYGHSWGDATHTWAELHHTTEKGGTTYRWTTT